MNKRLVLPVLVLLAACELPAPTRETIPWYWDRAEYLWIGNGQVTGTLQVHVESERRGGEELFVIRETTHRSFLGVTADTRITTTCRPKDSSDYAAFHLVPQSLATQAMFSNDAFESRSAEMRFENGTVTTLAGDPSADMAVPEDAWIEPVIRVLVTTMPRRIGAHIGMSIAYFDWKARELHPHQWIFFYGWEWTSVGGRQLYLARFDRMEGFDRQASYWVDRDNRLVKATAGTDSMLILKR